MNVLALALAVFALPALAQDFAPRRDSNEYSLNLLVSGSNHYTFEGGASARNDGGAGIGASLTRNLNSHFAVGADLTLSQFDYRARVAPGPGNAGAGFERDGRMEMIALRLNATWYLLSGPVTPFLTGGVGFNILDADLETPAPANACWIYPFYGQVCGVSPPQTTLTRLGYSAGAGVRFDLPRNQGFIRVLAGAEWIELSEATGSVAYGQLRADFGLRF